MRPGAFGAVALLPFALALAPAGPAAAQATPVYALSYLPDEQLNLICVDSQDAEALLLEFYETYRESGETPMAIMRGFEPEMGPDRRFDCGFIESIYLPQIPIRVIDLEVEFGLDWGERPEHFFALANLIVDGEQYTTPSRGDGIWVFTWDFVINKD